MAETHVIDAKPYLTYLDKEMTIMGLLSGFAITLGALVTERIVSAEKGFLKELWLDGRDHILAAGALAIAAGLLFYLQRSLLAWYYGQISLAMCVGSASSLGVEELLIDADGWDTWTRYQTGFVALTLSFLFYGYALGEALNTTFLLANRIWVLWLPLLLGIVFAAFRYAILGKYAQDENPFASWLKSIRGSKQSL